VVDGKPAVVLMPARMKQSSGALRALSTRRTSGKRVLDKREGRDFGVSRVVRGQHGGNTANSTGEPHIAWK
jgi:hypothetical protein